MKIFCHVPRENWIVDRMGNEFLQHSSHNVSLDRIEEDTEIIWLLASWCWNQIPSNILYEKKVICTIHHEVPEKFDEARKTNFLQRDHFIDQYLTYTDQTASFIKNITDKKIDIIPHWINNKIWKKLDKEDCRQSLGISKDKFVIGSFQRDTEGHDLISPKLEKGPDIFVEKVKDICKFKKNVHVLLSGWRRQYVISRLKEESIDFTYVELPDQEVINKLYNCLDLYIVSSRCEGGPQAIFEASYLKIPIISTRVGQSHFLSDNCLYDAKQVLIDKTINLSLASTVYNFDNVKNLEIGQHTKVYDNYMRKIYEKDIH